MSKMLSMGFVMIAVLVFRSGDAGARGIDDDVKKKYPESRYIVRQGTGESSEQAAEAARFEIAKYFESKISGQTLVTEWAKSATIQGKTSQSRMTAISNTVAVGASRDIPGIEIVGSEEDRKTKRFTAWAAVDRERLAQVLSERVAGVDREVDRRLAEPGGTDMARVAAFSRSMRDLVNREQDRRDLVLLGKPVESRSGQLHTVMTGLDSLIANVFDVALVFDGAADEKVRSVIFKSILDAGIRIKEYPDVAAAAAGGADLTVAVAHQVTKRKLVQNAGGKEFVFFWCDWMLSVKTLDPSTGAAIGTTVLSDKISGGSEEQAAERMVTRILQNEVPKVTAWISAMVFDPEKK